MNDVRIEPLLERLLSDAPTLRAPDRLRADIAIASGRKRRRPAWLAYLKEPPMRFHSRLVVGSPTIRVATVAAAVAVLLTLGGAALAASSLPPSPTVPTLPSPPYLTNFCDLASLDEVRAILGDEGAAVAHGLGRSKSTGLQSCVWRSEVPHERFLGVRDWTPSMFDDAKVEPAVYVQDATLTPLADLGDDAFVLTSPSEADLFVKKDARAANVFYRFADTESAAQMQQIATQMGSLVAERMSGAPSVHGEPCQLLTPEDIQAALQWTDVTGRSFATHCDWDGTNPADPMAGYLEIYDVPVEDFQVAKSLGGDPVPGMGDEAFILTDDNQPTLYVRKGDRAAAISTPHYNDAVQNYGPEVELKIGPVVAERLAAAPSGTPSTPVATAGTSPSVAWQPAEPTAVYDVPNAGGVISLATDGKTVWAAGDGEMLRIDGATGTVDHLPAPVATGDTFLLFADDGLWATQWQGGKIYRLDPTTGAVELALDVPAAVDPQLVGQDLWVGREDLGEMIHVDRVSGALGASIGLGAYAQGSPGALWFAVPGDPPTVVRVDPASGATVATIAVPAGTGCAIAGTVPDALFTSSCFARDAETRTFARIDPATNTVVATTDLPDTHGGNPVVAGSSTWLVGTFDAPDGSHFAGLVRVDPVSGAAQQWISLPGVEPDGSIGTANAIWIPDEAGHRVLRYDVANVTGP